ncbi:AAA-domain-containing protein [Massarina eburnea CBS 473.64]|uniref:AAA-domain-containing protein n=1 Tax=Massarina eburnea CBS 473.64 TaxID=1395130 RepID=A0A6A6RYZ3_9PLEO|nr:AAA-domain-containing protein [Massarina eburnea CBS 473.64]
MYGALRPALRAQRPPARLIQRRRYPHPAPLRARRLFHTTPNLAHDPNAPTGADGRPVDSNGVPEKKAGEEAAAAAAAVEPADRSVAPEDPELLAQKLQRSREMTRRYSSALRRTQRRNRAQDLPPVVIPQWFLEDRVLLRDDARIAPIESPEFTLSLRRREKEAVAQLSVPIIDPSIGSIVDALVRGEDPDATAKALRDQMRSHLVSLGDNMTDTQLLVESSSDEHLKQMQREWEVRDAVFASSIRTYESQLASYEKDTTTPHISPFVLAEIRATMAASLSVLQPGSDTYPAARTNLTLHSPFGHLEGTIHQTVKALASELGADVITLSAQDLAELGGDYLGEGPEPSPHSIRSLGYETHRLSSELDGVMDEMEYAAEETETDTASSILPNSDINGSLFPKPTGLSTLSSMLKDITQHLNKALQTSHTEPEPSNEVQGRVQTQAELQLEDLKLANLLEHILGLPEIKRLSGTNVHGVEAQQPSSPEKTMPSSSPRFFDFSLAPTTEAVDLDVTLPWLAIHQLRLSVNINPPRKETKTPSRSKVVIVEDIKGLSATQYGSRIIQKLEEIVRKQRSAGESIMIVGITCSRDLTPELSVDGVQGLQADGDSGYFRNIVVSAESVDAWRTSLAGMSGERRSSVTSANRPKFNAINVRHIQSMLQALDPVASHITSNRLDQDNIYELRASKTLFPEYMSNRVLTHDEVHRIALTALGLRLVDPSSETVSWSHVALAMGLLRASDEVKFEYIGRKSEILKAHHGEKFSHTDEKSKKTFARVQPQANGVSQNDHERRLQTIEANADRYEKRLMSGIVNANQIKIGFDQVHVPKETTEAIRSLTSLSFLRPDAFNYGVLATEKISGALLYGPPGTGKTLLARAVAKESGCAVLEVSGAQIHDKYVGEGEKNVQAIFSLARKLSPCVVFLDEADAVLSSRDTGRDRSSARDILNQFLKEWDGLSDHSVFVMVATNRPFDLDDAVIRRLPRRLLIDLPSENDRKEIIKIHLRGEQLDESVNVDNLAQQTPFYSGSDLKNIAVAAALTCVKEENSAAIAAKFASELSNGTSPSSNPPLQLLQGTDYQFPDKRVLHARHFEKALQEISASISEDMSSLNAIKKFDEKYGDKKGKKKKTVFGIGLGSEVNESVARVRPRA